MTKNSKAGFTLVETLVVLIISGIIVASIYQALNFGLTTLSRSKQIDDLLSDIKITQSLLRNQLHRVKIETRSSGYKLIDGDSTSLSIITTFPNSGIGHGHNRFSYNLENGKLVLTWQALPLSDGTSQSLSDSRILINDVESFSIRYATYEPRSKQLIWRDEWKDNLLPEVVEINLVLRENISGIDWPILYIRPQIQNGFRLFPNIEKVD